MARLIEDAKETPKQRDTTDYASFNEMAKAHRIVLKSIINNDLHYDIKDTIEINNGFGKQINFMKVMLESFKMMRVKPKKKDLFLK